MKLGKFVLALGTVLVALALGSSFVSCKGDGLEDPVEGDGATIIAIDIDTTAKSAGPDWNASAMSIWGWAGNYTDGNPFGTAWNGESTMLKKAPNENVYYYIFAEDALLPIGATICFHDDAAENSDRFLLDGFTLKRGEKKVVRNGKAVVWNVTLADLQQ